MLHRTFTLIQCFSVHVVGIDPRNDFKFGLNYCKKIASNQIWGQVYLPLAPTQNLFINGRRVNESYKVIY